MIASVELEGLEAFDLFTNDLIHNPFLSQEDVVAAFNIGDYSAWNDLTQFSPAESTLANTGSRVLGQPSVQHIEDGRGELNLDYYSVTITELPNSVSNATELLQHFQHNLDDFTNDATVFEDYNSSEGERFRSDDPLGSLMRFRVCQGGINVDDLSVMYSTGNDDYWVFSTMTTVRDASHPVSGNRQFGITTNTNGTYTFFTRGADRPHSHFDNWMSDRIFGGADNLWQAVMNSMVDYIIENGGAATRNVTISERTDWGR